ncbi:MarR family winged helix-turn-helix transcriptional regulator [Virgibacillus kekensis]|uniref:MarR family winged helix-turn-helix transcriptional regulator n=1 Tax=Virgibacillus kekensis TaxID=202261 RepID=A0ABV9DGS2_9BACI
MDEKQAIKISTLLWDSLTRVYKDNLNGTNELLKEWNLSNAQMDIIGRLGEEIVLSQQELADKLIVTKGNITQHIKKLEDLNLINRKKEWKTNYISLTDDGNRVYEELTPHLERYQLEKFSKLTMEEKKQLLHMLRKLHK